MKNDNHNKQRVTRWLGAKGTDEANDDSRTTTETHDRTRESSTKPRARAASSSQPTHHRFDGSEIDERDLCRSRPDEDMQAEYVGEELTRAFELQPKPSARRWTMRTRLSVDLTQADVVRKTSTDQSKLRGGSVSRMTNSPRRYGATVRSRNHGMTTTAANSTTSRSEQLPETVQVYDEVSLRKGGGIMGKTPVQVR